MPNFQTVSISEAQQAAPDGKRAQILAEYATLIEQVPRNQAGRLQPSPGESLATVRRRLGAAAKQFGKAVTIKRQGDAIYFWQEAPGRGTTRKPLST